MMPKKSLSKMMTSVNNFDLNDDVRGINLKQNHDSESFSK